MDVSRFYKSISPYLKSGSVLFLQGGRFVGKTILLNKLLANEEKKVRYESGENVQLQALFATGSRTRIESLAEDAELLVIDNVHLLHLFYDGFAYLFAKKPDLAVIAVSPYDTNFLKKQYFSFPYSVLTLYPLSLSEIKEEASIQEVRNQLEDLLIFGSYPTVVRSYGRKDKTRAVVDIFETFLLKDIVGIEKIKGSEVLFKLLRLIAFSIGTDISYTSLSKLLRIDHKTVKRYLELCEKAFIIFKLTGFSKKQKGEIYRTNKYYFYDTGIRNAVISNFNDLELRNDVKALWENYMIVERLKHLRYTNVRCESYFWRNWNKKEIDLVEKIDDKLFAYEFSFDNSQIPVPKEFKISYGGSEFKLIWKGNFTEFVGIGSKR
jgi:hypothetical protein